MGVLKVRLPGGPWLPITGVGGGITEAAADTRYVNVTGDTMTGNLTINAQLEVSVGGGQALVIRDSGAHIAFWNGANRDAYIQSNSTSGLYINSERGELALASSTSYVRFPNNIRVGFPTAYPGGPYGGVSWSNGQYLLMSDGNETFVSTPGSGSVHIRAGTNGTWDLNINNNGWHDMRGHLNMGAYTIHNLDNISCNGNQGGTCNLNHVTTYDGCRISSNGSWGTPWDQKGFIANRGSGGNRAGSTMHPGGVAKQWDMAPNDGGVFCHNEDGGWYADIWCNTVAQASSIRGKTDVAAWPPKSAGAAVMGASSRLSLIDVVSYRVKPECHLIHAESMLPDANGEVHKRLHDCAIDDCDGTPAEPCNRVKDQQNPHIGIIIEDLATVLPEAVSLDLDGKPGAMRMGTMLGYLLAVCKEQQERIEALEHQREAA
jgi:hypothetical protein